MSLVLHRDVHGSIPSVQLDVQFDSSVEESSREQDLLGLRNPLLVNKHSSLTGRLTCEFLLDVVNVLDFVSFVDLGECYLNCIELAAIDTHGCKCSPQSLFVDEATKSDDCFEIKFLDVFVKHPRIRRYRKCSEGAI